jgi:asparagine synthase (glutamine-hydrolysing)
MCGIAGIFGEGWHADQLNAMVESQRHRGPDGSATFVDPLGLAGLGHNRLSIIDLSSAGRQPMASEDGRYQIAFNGEIYNYVELRAELGDYRYRSETDTEVILAAYQRWGSSCLNRLVGMFAFLIWDTHERRLFAARDRFGVKPLVYGRQPGGPLMIASEIKALHAAGFAAEADPVTWATYLALGLYDHTARTFWKDVSSLPAGHYLTWGNNEIRIAKWYDLAEGAGAKSDPRSAASVEEEYLALLTDSVRLRFRSDVPIGVALSGGLDSSMLLGLINAVQGRENAIKAFTFITGDSRYDELPWVSQMLAHTRHPSLACPLDPHEIPDLAMSVQVHQDEPFGGVPTLAYAKLFERVRAEGVKVMLDGQGLDEQWAGYDYYVSPPPTRGSADINRTIQGTKERAVRPECLTTDLQRIAVPFSQPEPFCDSLKNLQYRDILYTKIPRALRFNDRISMRVGAELREPFLDHRLVELALRQPRERKVSGHVRKWLLRRLARRLLPERLVEAPKRPVQTPQREWLRGPLRPWASDCIETALGEHGGTWLNAEVVRRTWTEYCEGESDNSFYVWQWINLGLVCQTHARPVLTAAFVR